MARGGAREGAGKKTIDPTRKKVTFFINPEEKELLKAELAKIRFYKNHKEEQRRGVYETTDD